MGLLMTTKSRVLGFTSHPMDGAHSSVPVSIMGRLDPHRPQIEQRPLLATLTLLPAATWFSQESPIQVLRLSPA